MENTVFIDESGASGILDSVQPVFTLSAIHITEEEAESFCSEHLAAQYARPNRPSEIKFTKLLSRDNVDTLLSINEALLSSRFIRVYAVEKRYCLLCMAAMNSIHAEARIHDNYAELALYLRAKWDALSNKADMDSLLRAYYAAISHKELNAQYKRDFQNFVLVARDAIAKTQDPVLNLIIGGIANLREADVSEFEQSIGKLDMVSTFMSGLLFEIVNNVGRPFEIVLDKSNHDEPTFRMINLLATHTSGISVSSRKSHKSYGLLLADLLAGASRMAATMVYGYADEHDRFFSFSKRLAEQFQSANSMMFNLTDSPPTVHSRFNELLETFGPRQTKS